MQKFVLWGKYCDNALEKRTPFRDEHLSRLSAIKEQGFLLSLGPTECSQYVFGIFQGSSLEFVRTLLEEDIYWKEGIWTELNIYPWVQAF